MLVAVTGGSGFIGGRLVRALADAGHKVRVLTRRPPSQDFSSDSSVEHYQGDLITGIGLESFVRDVDLLFHCAGELLDSSLMEALHVGGTTRLIDAAAGRIGMWVQLSSTGAYGIHRTGSVTETTLANPVGTYETTKLASDRLVEAAASRGLFNYTILRPSIVFGSGMPNQSLYALKRTIEQRVFFFIGKVGASANYIHVENVVDALLLCGFRPEAKGLTFNLSDYRTIEQFVGLFAAAAGVSTPWLRLPEAPVRALARLLEPFPFWPLKESRVDALTSFARYSSERIETVLGYKHRVSMEEGVEDLVCKALLGST
jgi:nucleoside-diphosphate-sugar epimerase